MHEDAIQRAIDQWREMERKAAAFDRLLQELEKNRLVSSAVIDWAKGLVHPAQTLSTR